MKVWIVGHAYVKESVQEKLAALAALPDVDVTVLVPEAWRTPGGLEPLTVPPAPRYRVVASRLKNNGRTGAYRYRDGLATLRRARPDVVQAEVEPWSLAALQCARAAAKSRLVIFTWENLHGPRRSVARVIERFVLRRTAFVIAGNDAARRRMMGRGVPADRIAVLPQFGVDPDRYALGDRAARRATLELTSPVVGYVGRLVPEKGVDILVDALDALDAHLFVVGNGSERAALEARTAGWPPGKVRFVGAVKDTDVPDFLAAMDVLVLPSRTMPTWAEQFGHVLIEAMAAGVPVIGSSSGAIPEVIGDAGLTFAEGDAAALRKALGGLLADADLRARLAERGRERVRRHYSHAVVAEALVGIYRRLLPT